MMSFLGLDLNSECGFCDPAKHNFVGAIDEPRQAGVCAADATSSVDYLPPLRHPLSGRAQSSKLYHLGIRSAVARNTLANANAVRDWRIYADFAQSLIGIARPLYAQESFGVDLQETVYALDTTTIGTSENAVRSQIWIAVSAYVLVAIVKKRLQLSASLYEILQILSLT